MLKLSLALNLLYFAESTAYRAPNLGRLGRGRLGITTASGDGAASVLRTTHAASMSARTTAIRAEKPTALLHAAALGAGTACMGTLYARCLRFAVTLVWRRLPAALPLADATLFVPAACTVGGLLVGLTALRLQGYTMPELIARYQDEAGAPGGASPAASVLPVLLLSLLTSTFGFSVGPEAPMVVAGSLVGAAYARRVYGAGEHAMARTMAYAGAAGALTTFIGMPLAGALFVLELTRASSGLHPEAYAALTPAVAASCASMLVARALLAPAAPVGGHFAYSSSVDSALDGRALAAVSLGAGLGGALIGRLFLAAVAAVRRPLWPQAPAGEACEAAERRWACGPEARQVLVKGGVGAAVGLLSLLFPQTLFWGEGSLQHVLDGQRTPLSDVWPGLPPALTARALVDVSSPFPAPAAAVAVGGAKLLAIALACAGGFPGGVIFPLFFAAAAVAHGFAGVVPAALMPAWVMSLMAATQASVTRTPLATVFMLGLSAAASAQLSVLLPPVIIASYVGVWASRALSTATFFPYKRVD
uniref:Chloride channel protein n=1 Tax=Emiliania huxleyi TaxID=2903 RepID=A0A7S3RW28_EMIHU